MSKLSIIILKKIQLESSQIFNCLVSNSQFSNSQIFGATDHPEKMQTTEPPAAHQKGEPVNLKHYDCSEVLDLSQKPNTTSDKTTLSSLPAGEDDANNDDTIIYEIPDEQVDVQQPEEHDPDNESTDVRRGKYSPMYLFESIQLEIVASIPEDRDGQKYYILVTDDQSWHKVTRDRRNL